jgi:hypothetical protein
MKVKPETYKDLVAVKNGKVIKIPNKILRKASTKEQQNKNLTKNSVCIVCNFRFLENKVDWSKKVKAICHPFRDDSIFPKNIDKYLFSESDFCDKLTTDVKSRFDKWDNMKYDFVYFTLNSREGTRSKGIYMLPLLDKVAGCLKLRGLVVDYAVRETAKHKGTIYHTASKIIKSKINSFKNLKVIKNNYSTKEVCAIMLGSKFVFLPSTADASPRILVEALVRNRPLVVNSSIYGGWKYINDNNGSFFDGPSIEEFISNKYKKDYEKNLKDAIIKVLSIDNTKISKEFYLKYGFVNSSTRLASIVNRITGKKYKAVAFKEWKKSLIKSFLK